MSDFLHNLRNGNANNRYDRPRKNYDNPQYRPSDRHNTRDKRNGNQRKPYQAEQFTVIKKILEEIQENQKVLIQATRDRADSEKRMAKALEAIASHLATAPAPATVHPPQTETLSDNPITTEASHVEPVEVEAVSQDEPAPESEAAPNTDHGDPALIRKEEALSAIQLMRDQGLTYEKIARNLETQGVPTVSGRGKWRGQAVSKLLAEA